LVKNEVFISMAQNILQRALDIVYNRSEEKNRQYGDFHESMDRATNIYNLISKNQISVEDMYKAMIALKLSRQYNSHKEDNLLDIVAYMASMNDLNNKQK